MRHHISDLLTSHKGSPVLVGPWLGEIGPELQYWVPYLQKIRDDGLFGGHRVIAISRGGVDAWYRGITDEYVEVYDYVGPDEFRTLLLERDRGIQKQIAITANEERIINTIARNLDLRDALAIHPSIMWQEILPFLTYREDLDRLWERLAFKRFGVTPARCIEEVDAMGLPGPYIAVKFYSSHQVSDDGATREIIRRLIEQITRTHAVVLMGLRQQIDDHCAIIPGDMEGVIDVSDRLELPTNLGVQTEIIRRSAGFVGTTGGIALLPLFLDVPALSFQMNPLGSYTELYCRHEAMITRLFEEFGRHHTVISPATWDYISRFFAPSGLPGARKPATEQRSPMEARL
jgi:hypothetical protein